MSVVWRGIVEISKSEDVTLLDREESMLSKLKVLVGSLELDLEVEDRIIWIHDSAEEFTVKKLSDLLTYDGMGANDFPFGHKKFMVDSNFDLMLDHVKPPPPGWMKFNVVGVALEDEVGCGGILRDDKGVACALFLGWIEAKRLEMVEIMAIKTTMHMYIGSSR
ncbi:hypothetical protein Gogos_021983 [Gossypium gossypioides]|uniref:RNase H type-1 domain-containing protein n=1 Tax=Gossypium gossypioides TaxID=34282 RepID=A0A7J9D695_GOSGO|nr:hypothetical protein [Gossypium gossypioides]